MSHHIPCCWKLKSSLFSPLQCPSFTGQGQSQLYWTFSSPSHITSYQQFPPDPLIKCFSKRLTKPFTTWSLAASPFPTSFFPCSPYSAWTNSCAFFHHGLPRGSPGFLSSHFSSVQSLNQVRLFATPWTAARQASLSANDSACLHSPPLSVEVFFETPVWVWPLHYAQITLRACVCVHFFIGELTALWCSSLAVSLRERAGAGLSPVPPSLWPQHHRQTCHPVRMP